MARRRHPAWRDRHRGQAEASFVSPQAVLHGLRHLRPQLTSPLSDADAMEAKLAQRMPPLYQQLELDLARSVLQAYLRCSTAPKRHAREARATEHNT